MTEESASPSPHRAPPWWRERLREIGVEIVIVVVGILIAFALNSWWEERSAKASERAHLIALRGDFAQNARSLQAQAERDERIGEAALRVLRAPQRSTLPRDSVIDLLGPLFNSSAPETVMGAYQALVSSGELPRIRDDSLRRALADFASEIDNRYAERLADDLYASMIRDMAGETRWLAWLDDRTLKELGLRRAEAAWDPMTLLRDPRFQDYVMMRYLMTRSVGTRHAALATRAKAILARIQRDLGEPADGATDRPNPP